MPPRPTRDPSSGRGIIRLGPALLLLLATAQPFERSHAREGDLEQPIDISAERSEYDERAGTQTLLGDVEIRQGTMLITADRITVGLADSRLASIEGEGSPIRFEQENDAGETIRGEARSLGYDATSGTLVLSGAATLTRPGQTLSSERIVFDARTQTVSAEGAAEADGERGRVSIRIEPPPATERER